MDDTDCKSVIDFDRYASKSSLNHLSKEHRPLLVTIVTYLESIKRHYDFVFSCTLIPEDYYDDIELMRLLKDAGILQIHAPFEHTSDGILKYYNIGTTKRIMTTFLKSIFESGIPSLNIHYVIGSPMETSDTLNALLADSVEFSYETEKGSIELSISGGIESCFVRLSYFDRINGNVIRAEAMDDL